MQEKTTETLAFRAFGPQDGHPLTSKWGEEHNSQPLQVLAVGGDRFCAAGPDELVFGRTAYLREWSPAEFVRVPLEGATIIRALASHEFVVAHGSELSVFGPTGKKRWSTTINNLKSLNAHPKNARFSYCDATGGYIVGDNKLKKVAATHIIWNHDGTQMAKVNGSTLSIGGSTAEVPEEVVSGGFIGARLLLAGADKKFLWDGSEVSEAPEIVGPFGNEDRTPVWYVLALSGWPSDASSMAVCTFSQGTDLVFLDEEHVFEPSDDDARGLMPFSEDTGTDTAPCGAAIDWTSTTPVLKPFAGVDKCGPQPLFYVLSDEGKLLMWSVVSKTAIKEDYKLPVEAATAAIELPEVEPKEELKEEPREEPKLKEEPKELTEEPVEVKKEPETPEEPVEAPKEPVESKELETPEPKAEPEAEPETEVKPEAPEAEKEQREPEVESEEELKEPEAESHKEPPSESPSSLDSELDGLGLASRHAAPEAKPKSDALQSRHAAPAAPAAAPAATPSPFGTAPAIQNAFGKPSALGSFGKPLSADFGNTKFSFGPPAQGNVWTTGKAAEPAKPAASGPETPKASPFAGVFSGSATSSTLKENPFAKFTQKSMVDAVKVDENKAEPASQAKEAPSPIKSPEPPVRRKPNFFDLNVDEGAGNITTTSTVNDSEGESGSEESGSEEDEDASEDASEFDDGSEESDASQARDFSHLDISDRFGARTSETSASEDDGSGSETEDESDEQSGSQNEDFSEVSEQEPSDGEASSTESLVHVEPEVPEQPTQTPVEAPKFTFGAPQDSSKPLFGSAANSTSGSLFGRPSSGPSTSAFGSQPSSSESRPKSSPGPIDFSGPKLQFGKPQRSANSSLASVEPEFTVEEPESENDQSPRRLAQLALSESTPEAKSEEFEKPTESAPEPAREPTPEPSPTPEPEYDPAEATVCESPAGLLPLEPRIYSELGSLDQVYAETNSLFQVLDNNLQALAAQVDQQRESDPSDHELLDFASWRLADAAGLSGRIQNVVDLYEERAAQVPEVASTQPLIDAIERAVADLRQLAAALRSAATPNSNASQLAAMPLRSTQLQYRLRQKLGGVRELIQEAEERLTFLRVQRGQIPKKADLGVAIDIISRKVAAVSERYPDIFHAPTDMRMIASDMHDLSLTPPDAFDRKKFLDGNNRAGQLKQLGRRLQTVPADSVLA